MMGTTCVSRLMALFLCLCMFGQCDGDCDFSGLAGMKYFVEYNNGEEVIMEFIDNTNEIITTQAGNIVETLFCLQEQISLDLFDSYIFFDNSTATPMFLCVELVARGDYIFFRKVASATILDIAGCVVLLTAAPNHKYILVKYPLEERITTLCGLDQGLFHAVFGNTVPPSCHDDPRSEAEVKPMEVDINTCFSGSSTYNFPHQVDIDCLGSVSPELLGSTERYAIGRAQVEGRTDLYCVRLSVENGVQMLHVQPRVGHLVCNAANPEFKLTLLIDQCDLGVCQNGATCTQLSNSYTCSCPPGYAGRDCSSEIDECNSSPCVNGVCIDIINGYTCNCDNSGFIGLLCETEIDECDPNPCANGATCHDDIGFFTCQCPPGFTGFTCNQEVNECLSAPCQAGAQCIDHIAYYECLCKPGYTGITCEINIDECASNPCENNGRCHDLDNKYECVCQPGFDGVHCEMDRNECASRPCLNGGICTDQSNAYSCTCPEGIEGTNCEININDCEDVDCGEGVCEDEINDFTCVCNFGYGGEYCDMKITTPKPTFAPSILDNDIIPLMVGLFGALAAILMLACVCMIRSRMRAKKSEEESPSRRTLGNSGITVTYG